MSEENFTPEEQQTTPVVPQKTSNTNKGLLFLNIVLLISIGVLYVLFFTQNNKQTADVADTKNAEGNTEASYGNLKIAYVNTDSVLVNYKLASDLEKELDTYGKNLENNYTSKAKKLQSDFQEYLKIGATLTLTEQKNREESFKKREMELVELERRMMGQIQEKQITENVRLLNAVYAFIRDYNQKNQQFNIVLKKSFADTPVLYIDESMDITKEIIDGLNKEYEDLQKK